MTNEDVENFVETECSEASPEVKRVMRDMLVLVAEPGQTVDEAFNNLYEFVIHQEARQ